jgi:ribonuclease HII
MVSVVSVLVCGVDEAGRGPLAGPVYAAAVILDKKRRINGLADSKVLTPQRRDVLAGRIRERAIAWAVAHATVEEIDRLNIFHASMLAMRRAVQALKVQPEEAWVDGNHCPAFACEAKAIVDGDATHAPISAASILAKTERDAEMCTLSARFPQYGFDRHKGYATSEHLDALGRLGPCEIHRRSFHAVGVFFQKDLFSVSWGTMAEPLRVRSYRLYCDARKLTTVPALTLLEFNARERRLRRQYADVLSSREAVAQVERMEGVLAEAKAQLRPSVRPKRTD